MYTVIQPHPTISEAFSQISAIKLFVSVTSVLIVDGIPTH